MPTRHWPTSSQVALAALKSLASKHVLTAWYAELVLPAVMCRMRENCPGHFCDITECVAQQRQCVQERQQEIHNLVLHCTGRRMTVMDEATNTASRHSQTVFTRYKLGDVNKPVPTMSGAQFLRALEQNVDVYPQMHSELMLQKALSNGVTFYQLVNAPDDSDC